jgi:hypothetical protein
MQCPTKGSMYAGRLKLGTNSLLRRCCRGVCFDRSSDLDLDLDLSWKSLGAKSSTVDNQKDLLNFLFPELVAVM